MADTTLFTSEKTDLREYIGKPLRTKGCMLVYCISGCAVLECNFKRKAFRKYYMALIFSDTLFSVEKVSEDFSVIKYELSIALTDEVTYISSGLFFDWLDENQVCAIPEDRRKDIALWLEGMEWINRYADAGYRNVMMRNLWQSFFLGFESVVEPFLKANNLDTISSSRKLFDRFCQSLCQNCRTRHDVKFYADELCITPYYLARITSRIFQTSPKELIDRQLVMEIKAMLTTTNLTVTEIADRFCFESASYLGRYFRRHTGMSPLEYRKQQTTLSHSGQSV